ncbi:hypothetical protein DMN91_005975, partial [Ooceraea biroi]
DQSISHVGLRLGTIIYPIVE